MEMSEKSHERRAIVIGGSIAGLFVGAFLRRIGWRVNIYERSSIELIGRGVGIFATHLELLEALDKCGAGTVDIGVIVYKRVTFDRKGDVIAEKPQLQIVTSWDRLRQVLLKAIDRQRYHFGHVFERVKQMCVDDQGREYEFGVPPPLVRKDLVEQMRAEAEALLPPQYLDCLRHIDQPFFTPVYDFCSPGLVFGRVALVGDAASTPRPHIGFGVSKAGAEAQALAEALSNHDDIDQALAAYNAVRQPLSQRIVTHARKLGTQLGVGIETDKDRRLSKLLQTPKGIMDWIAVPNFLEMRV
jgi:2-polyprenyl-6-methoxyphenol hydroxylase-like FAD-dependent oxidoreductase